MSSLCIGLSQMPVMRVEQRQTLFRTCPHCGTVNEVGRIGASGGGVIILCWACKEPLFDKNSKFIPFDGQEYTKFTVANKPKESKESKGKLITKSCPNCGNDNRCGENEAVKMVNGVITVCWACFSPLFGKDNKEMNGTSFYKAKFRKAKVK